MFYLLFWFNISEKQQQQLQTSYKTTLKTKKTKQDSSTCRHEEIIGFLSNWMQFYIKNKKVINPLMQDNAGNTRLSLNDFLAVALVY